MAVTTKPATKQLLISQRLREGIAGYVLALPAVIPLVVFLILPIIASVVLIFMDYGLLTPPKWIGVENIVRWVKDERMWASYRNTILITIGAVILNNLLGLLLAMGVNRKMKAVFRYLLRTSLFFPVLTTTASLALVWRFLLTQDRGVINWLLSQVGVAPVPWLSSPTLAIVSVVIYDVWKSCGYLMVIYLAGLQAIPESLYEAAKVDGANRWQLTRFITLPLITPTTFFCIIISSIGAFQMFDNAYVLTNGGPGDASRTVSMYVYEMAFKRYEMGYAATVSVSLLIVLLILTLLQFWIGRKWVHYD